MDLEEVAAQVRGFPSQLKGLYHTSREGRCFERVSYHVDLEGVAVQVGALLLKLKQRPDIVPSIAAAEDCVDLGQMYICITCHGALLQWRGVLCQHTYHSGYPA